MRRTGRRRERAIEVPPWAAIRVRSPAGPSWLFGMRSGRSRVGRMLILSSRPFLSIRALLCVGNTPYPDRRVSHVRPQNNDILLWVRHEGRVEEDLVPGLEQPDGT